jgi:hypothetical protein
MVPLPSTLVDEFNSADPPLIRRKVGFAHLFSALFVSDLGIASPSIVTTPPLYRTRPSQSPPERRKTKRSRRSHRGGGPL